MSDANRVEYHEGAAADVRAAVLWYQKRSPKAALDFIDELNRATRIISRTPDRWAHRKCRYQAIPAVALSPRADLFTSRIAGYGLGGRPCQPQA